MPQPWLVGVKRRAVLDESIFLDSRLFEELSILINMKGWNYKTNRNQFQRRDKGLVCLLILTGLRISEALILRKQKFRAYKDRIVMLSIISRVVVHPKYRTIGLGHWLIEKTLREAGTRYVELVAVMAKYNPFAEKAGMRKIAVQEGNVKALQIASFLRELGFNMQLLGSRELVLEKLKSLKGDDLALVKEAFVVHKHLRFMKPFFHGKPYGLHAIYRRKVLEASLETMAYLSHVCSMLMQTKVYLFWDAEAQED